MRVAAVGIGVAALVVGGVLLWLRRRLMVVTVVGLSMEPTLRAGERLLARRGAAVTRDIVVIRNPKGDPPLLVKRLVASAGEELPAALGGGVYRRAGSLCWATMPSTAWIPDTSGCFCVEDVVGVALRRIGGGALDV